MISGVYRFWPVCMYHTSRLDGGGNGCRLRPLDCGRDDGDDRGLLQRGLFILWACSDCTVCSAVYLRAMYKVSLKQQMADQECDRRTVGKLSRGCYQSGPALISSLPW